MGQAIPIRCGRCCAPSGAALLTLNVPHFVSPSDGGEIGDAYGASVRTQAISGLARARERLQNFDDTEIAWQIEVIRENTNSILPAADARPQTMPREETTLGRRRRRAGQSDFHRRSRPDRSGACRATPFAADRPPPGSGSTGSATPRFSSWSVSAPISTTARPASRSFLPRMRRRPGTSLPANWRWPPLRSCART